MGSFDLFCPYLNGELLKNWEQCEVRIHVVHIIVKLITLMFLHRKRNVPYNWSQIWQLPQSNFKCFIPFIVFNSVSRIKHAKKEKKCIRGVFCFCHAKVEDRCYSYLLHIMCGYHCDKVTMLLSCEVMWYHFTAVKFAASRFVLTLYCISCTWTWWFDFLSM